MLQMKSFQDQKKKKNWEYNRLVCAQAIEIRSVTRRWRSVSGNVVGMFKRPLHSRSVERKVGREVK